MKFKMACIAGGVLFLSSLSALAQTDVQPSPTPDETAPTEQSVRNKDESWYFDFGFGWVSPGYGSETNALIDKLKDIGTGFKRTPVAVDLGFYWPKEDKRSVVGVSLFGVNDKIEVSGYTIEVTQSVIAASWIQYFGENVGDGFWGRADLGLGKASTSTKVPAGAAAISDAASDWGFAIQLGAGYSLPVSPETRLSLGLYYSSLRVEDDKTSNLSVQLGCLL